MDYEKDFEEGYENTSLGSIYYRYHPGSGKKMIFLHGLGSSSKTWAELMGYMPDDFDILLLDLLGHGKSDKPRIDYTIETQFQALREFIALRNSGDSYIYGASYGGWLAAYYATQPYTCKGIILQCAIGLQEFADERLNMENLESGKERLVRGTMQHNPSNDEYAIRSIINYEYTEGLLTTDLLNMIKVPTLIIWGSDDITVDKKYGKLFAEKIKNSRLEIIEGAAHMAQHTHPGEISKLILEFMSQHG